jgi:hypothetical protein
VNLGLGIVTTMTAAEIRALVARLLAIIGDPMTGQGDMVDGVITCYRPSHGFGFVKRAPRSALFRRAVVEGAASDADLVRGRRVRFTVGTDTATGRGFDSAPIVTRLGAGGVNLDPNPPRGRGSGWPGSGLDSKCLEPGCVAVGRFQPYGGFTFSGAENGFARSVPARTRPSKFKKSKHVLI